MAQVHSGRADNIGNRLEKRFGHPSMHAELFTPMVHANMTALLPQVFSGKISSTQTKLDEFGGTKMDTQVVAGGIKIAGIEQVSFRFLCLLRLAVSYLCFPSVFLLSTIRTDICYLLSLHPLILAPALFLNYSPCST